MAALEAATHRASVRERKRILSGAPTRAGWVAGSGPAMTNGIWEQGKRVPEGPTRAYLIVIDRAPNAVRKALAA